MGAIKEGMKEENIFINEDTACAHITAKTILENSLPGELIMFKGSHALNMQRIYEEIKKLYNGDKNA